MPTKDDPRITVRLDESLYERLREAARAKQMTTGGLVRSLLTEALRRPPQAVGFVDAEKVVADLPPTDAAVAEGVAAAREQVEAQFGGRVVAGYSCPVPGCRFSAPSPRAVCGKHGRTVR